MPCLNPKVIRNRRYLKMTGAELQRYCFDRIGLSSCLSVKRDSPTLYEEHAIHTSDDSLYLPPDYFISVPCGKCAECRKKRRLEWSVRLALEVQNYKSCTFLTLTLDDESLERFKDNPKRPILLYIDRLRKVLGFRPKYFFVSELGETTNRLHYHGIIFNTDKKRVPFEVQRGKWLYGHVWLGEFCDIRTAFYITKYMLKQQNACDYKPVLLVSNGIGESYVNSSSFDWHLNNFEFRDYLKVDGKYYPFPRYYANKFFDDDLKLAKMLNRYNDTTERKFYLNSHTYFIESDFVKAREKWYRETKRLNLSL